MWLCYLTLHVCVCLSDYLLCLPVGVSLFLVSRYLGWSRTRSPNGLSNNVPVLQTVYSQAPSPAGVPGQERPPPEPSARLANPVTFN